MRPDSETHLSNEPTADEVEKARKARLRRERLESVAMGLGGALGIAAFFILTAKAEKRSANSAGLGGREPQLPSRRIPALPDIDTVSYIDRSDEPLPYWACRPVIPWPAGHSSITPND